MSFVLSCTRIMKVKEVREMLMQAKEDPEAVLVLEYEAKQRFYEMKKAARIRPLTAN